MFDPSDSEDEVEASDPQISIFKNALAASLTMIQSQKGAISEADLR